MCVQATGLRLCLLSHGILLLVLLLRENGCAVFDILLPYGSGRNGAQPEDDARARHTAVRPCSCVSLAPSLALCPLTPLAPWLTLQYALPCIQNIPMSPHALSRSPLRLQHVVPRCTAKAVHDMVPCSKPHPTFAMSFQRPNGNTPTAYDIGCGT